MGGYFQDIILGRQRVFGFRKESSWYGRPYMLDEDRTQLASSLITTTISYRDKGSIEVPEFIADPYRHFLQEATLRKRETARLRYGYKSPTRFHSVGPTTVPVTFGSRIVDDGHTYKKDTVRITTSQQAYAQETYNAGGYSERVFIERLYAAPGLLSDASRSKMLFAYSGNDPMRHGIPAADDFNLPYIGQKMIARGAPNRPQISLAAILGELREGLPSLPGLLSMRLYAQTLMSVRSTTTKSAHKAVKAYGSEYVNVQFGVLPLLSDLQDIAQALLRCTNIFKQYQHDAARGVRRKMAVPIRRESVTFGTKDFVQDSPGNISAMPVYLPGKAVEWSGGLDISALGAPSRSEALVTQRVIDKIAFSGSFTYYIPMGNSFEQKIEKYETLYEKLAGPSMSIEALWQLAPWSWLADWLFDLNTTISSYERMSADNLVMNYGYVSVNSVRSSKATCVFHWTPGDRGLPAPELTSVQSTITRLYKERIRANPFGFTSKTADSLDERQWAILAGIGISRS